MGIPCFKALAGKVSFHTSSWALPAILAFICLDQLTKAHYRGSFSTAVIYSTQQTASPFPFLHECFCTFVSHIWSVKEAQKHFLYSVQQPKPPTSSQENQIPQKEAVWKPCGSYVTCEFCLSKSKPADLNMWRFQPTTTAGLLKSRPQLFHRPEPNQSRGVTHP